MCPSGTDFVLWYFRSVETCLVVTQNRKRMRSVWRLNASAYPFQNLSLAQLLADWKSYSQQRSSAPGNFWQVLSLLPTPRPLRTGQLFNLRSYGWKSLCFKDIQERAREIIRANRIFRSWIARKSDELWRPGGRLCIKNWCLIAHTQKQVSSGDLATEHVTFALSDETFDAQRRH